MKLSLNFKPLLQATVLSFLILISMSLCAMGSTSLSSTLSDYGVINYGSTSGAALRLKSSFDSPVTLIGGTPPTSVSGGDISPYSWSQVYNRFYYAGGQSCVTNIIDNIPSNQTNGPTGPPPGSLSNRAFYMELRGGSGYQSIFHNELEVWELDGGPNSSYQNYLTNMSKVYASLWVFFPTTYDLSASGGWHALWSDRENGNSGATQTHDYSGASLNDMFANVLYLYRDSAGLYWHSSGVHYQGSGSPFTPYTWQESNHAIPVPRGRWFHLEIYLERSITSGVFKVWVDGQVVFDVSNTHPPSSMPFGVVRTSLGNTVHRMNLAKEYSAVGMAVFPLRQWIDDVEIWDGLKPGAGA